MRLCFQVGEVNLNVVLFLFIISFYPERHLMEGVQARLPEQLSLIPT